MFRGKFLSSMDNIDAVLTVRAQVPEFSGVAREPQDGMAFFALAFDEDDTPCGSGRLYIDADSHFRIDRLGVLPDPMKVTADGIRLEGSCSKGKNGCSGDCANCKS